MTESTIFYNKTDDPEMSEAFTMAQKTFKYFWRELSWEYRRVVPALDLGCIKVAFAQQLQKEEMPIVEHMWLNEIDFDGDLIYGKLVNKPNQLTNIQMGDKVEVPVSRLSDWIFAIQGKTYGGFTIQLMRSRMAKEELIQHDEAWGLDFGDFNSIEIVYQQSTHPHHLLEHPMSINSGDSLSAFLAEKPYEIDKADANGFTFLHREAIAGNKTSVEMLIQAGAQRDVKTHSGRTAYDFAQLLEWEQIIPLLKLPT